MWRPSRPEATHELNPFGALEMARTLSFLFVVGGCSVIASVLLGASAAANRPALVAIGAAAILFGPLLLSYRTKLSAHGVGICLLFGQACITGVIYFDGPQSVFAAFYCWVAAEAFLYLSRREIAVQLVVTGVAYASMLALLDAPGPVERWVGLMGITLGLGLLVAYLRVRLEEGLRRLREIALTDELTGVPNRRAFLDRFDQELAQAERHVRSLGVLICDLDGFKLVNDRLGHPEGDEVLRRVADVLRAEARTGDTLARIGGEEFAVLLPMTDLPEAMLVADRMLDAVREAFAGDDVPVTMSIGLAAYPEQGANRSELMRAADHALYRAKESGRDRMVVYDPDAVLSARAAANTGEIALTTAVSLAEALDIRDTGPAEHSRAVAGYARLMADHMGFDPDHAERIGLAGLVHDVGKMGISDRVLTKPGPLDDAEWAQMKTHPQIGARLLAHPELADLRSWVVAHHERPDGRGYPFGLAGDEIAIESKILSVADAYEAMTADRVYKRAMAEEAAREELRACAGKQFDAEVVEVFLDALTSEEMVIEGA